MSSKAISPRRRKRSRTRCSNTARRSSSTSCTTPACCAPRWKSPWVTSPRAASSPPTATRACARSSRPRCARPATAAERRGGRFVQGYSGEQFALPEAVGSLRDTRKRPARGEFITLSAADPLNLAGILTPGTKVPALAGNRILFRGGVPAAALIAGEFEALQTLSTEEQRQMRERLLGKTVVSFQAKRPA